MAPIKRKGVPSTSTQQANTAKKVKKEEPKPDLSKISETLTDSDPYTESDTASQSGDGDGGSWPSDDDEVYNSEDETAPSNGQSHVTKGHTELARHKKSLGTTKSKAKKWGNTSTEENEDTAWDGINDEEEGGVTVPPAAQGSSNGAHNGAVKDGLVSSREAHAKQKTAKQERKASKPNAEAIAKCKKLWERLRQRKVSAEERKKLIYELLKIIEGQVKDLVLKHDSVRVIETALKYASQQQKKVIAKELKGEYKLLSESKYGKFLVGKLLSYGDKTIRDLVIPEFYGHVRRLIKHPEAAWILDDVYRGAASPSQKDALLREWYGPEFAIFKSSSDGEKSSDLKAILAANPEKRSPIMHHLHDLINQLIQKKTSAYTMLHDAMLQYYQNLTPGSEDSTNFLELLKSDEENDLLKNLAFTSSGSRLICLVLANTDAKQRKFLLRPFKGTIQLMTYDTHAHQIILTACEVVDDTVLTSKHILSELLLKDNTSSNTDKLAPTTTAADRESELLSQINHKIARCALLYLSASNPKAYLPASDLCLLDEIHTIRQHTSKKNPATRRQELLAQLCPPLLELITTRVDDLVATSYGCQFITEIVLSAPAACGAERKAAVEAIIALLRRSEGAGEHNTGLKVQLQQPHASRMLKNLVQGGRYDAKLERVVPCEPALGFREGLSQVLGEEKRLLDWAVGPHAFVILAMVEGEAWQGKEEVMRSLKRGKARLKDAAQGKDGEKGSQGAKLLLDRI